MRYSRRYGNVVLSHPTAQRKAIIDLCGQIVKQRKLLSANSVSHNRYDLIKIKLNCGR